MINKWRRLPNPTGSADWTANGTGVGVDISDLGEKDFFTWAISGAFSASVQVQVSAQPAVADANGMLQPPGAADPSWMNLGTALAATGTAHSLVRALWARAVVGSYVSGTIAVEVVGDYAHEAGGRRARG